MRVFKGFSQVGSASVVVILGLAMLTAVQAQQQESEEDKVGIKNFGAVNPILFRGAQPEDEDYAKLAAIGIKTVIDLQRVGEPNEQRLVEAAGMKFFRIPMSDRSRPDPAKAEKFLSLVNDPANQPVFIHCRGGRHRTGAMAAIYRLTKDGWNAEQAVAEMKKFDFERGFGHGALKDFVYDYYTQMNQKGIVVNSHQ
jgi:protein tyrosine/serine phosphatase